MNSRGVRAGRIRPSCPPAGAEVDATYLPVARYYPG